MTNTNQMSSKEERQGKLRDLNPEVDRTPAKLGQIDDSKLRIELVTDDGKDPVVYQYSGTIDWTNPASITACNRWRKDTFYDNLGPLKKQKTPGTIKKEPFLDREISWVAAHSAVYLFQDKYGLWQGWTNLTEAFNKKFGGKVCPEDSVPRPYRSVVQMRSLKYDIDVKAARGLTVIDHDNHRRHTGGARRTRVLGNSRVKNTGEKTEKKKHNCGNHADGYSWAGLLCLAEVGCSKSKPKSKPKAS